MLSQFRVKNKEEDEEGSKIENRFIIIFNFKKFFY